MSSSSGKSAENSITADRLRELLHYNPDTGVFTWRVPKGKRVSWHRTAGKWRAKIEANGKYHYLGHFSDPAEAHAAYLSAKAQLHTFNPTVRGEE